MPSQRAYEAVYAYINSIGGYLPPDEAHRNAMIWRAVEAVRPIIASETLEAAAHHLDVIESASAEELPVRPSPGEYLRARAAGGGGV